MPSSPIYITREPRSSVWWGHGAFSFELNSSDNELLAKASSLFSRWQPMDVALPLQRWWIEPLARPHEQPRRLWDLRSSTGPSQVAAETCERLLRKVEFSTVQTLVDHPQCSLCFHGALVARNSKSVMILGPNEGGKSTLACALWQQGWSLVGDDLTFVDTETRVVSSAPRRVSLREPSRGLLGDFLWTRIQATPSYHQTEEGCLFHPDDVSGPITAPPLAAIIFLARRGMILKPAQWQRITPAHALLALMPYSNMVRTRGPAEALAHIQPLAAQVPTYDLGRGPLPEMIHAVEQLLQDI